MSRKRFLEALLLIILIPFVWLVSSTISKKRKWTIPSIIKLPDNFSKEVTFVDKIIVIKSSSEVKFLSATCTHLGCRINKIENSELLCPCHGSRFSMNGEVLKGPATESLAVFPHTHNKEKKEFIITIRNKTV